MRIHLAIVAALLLTGLAACNTVEGAGKDIQAGGKVIADTAEKTKRAISD